MFKLRLQKYIFWEIIVPMGLGIFILSFILLMGNLLKLTDLVINKGVPFKEIALLFVYIFPSFLDIALGMAFLLGILIGFGRLSADSELIAMKVAGVSLGTMLKPVVILSLIVSLGIAWVLFYAKPVSRTNFKEHIFSIVNNRLATGLQPMVFNNDFDDVVLYAENVDPRSGDLENIFLHDQRDPASPTTIFAQRGKIFSNPQLLTFSINLEDGTLLTQPAKENKPSFQILRFGKYDVKLSFDDRKNTDGKSNIEPKTLRFNAIGQALAANPTEEDRHLLKIEWHKRLALVLAPLLFTMIGVPLGIHSPRSGKIGGFTIALLVFLAYFMLSSFAETICKDGNINFYALIWLPNLLFLIAGGFLLFCASREREIFSFFSPGNRIRRKTIAQGLERGGK